LDSFKYTLLTLVNLIFIPLGVLVGYFGMNFASMGVPDVKSGILSVGSGEWLVAVIGLSIIVTIIIGYAYFFGFHLPN
jgi:Mg2+ and Co2+ transporter CorA